jgi:hypothetical protein
MDDTAVPASLVLREIFLLFQNQDPRLGIFFAHSQSRTQSDDTTSDDCVIMHA